MTYVLIAALLLMTPLSTPEAPPPIVEGFVWLCQDNNDVPVSGAQLIVDGQVRTQTDDNGEFAFQLPPGNYTVVATDGTHTGQRYYVPLQAGDILDIGAIELDKHAAVFGCGDDQ